MLYQTRVSNQEGITGHLHFSDNQDLATKHPLEAGSGYNPEQLIASAWATCLNATIQSILEAKGFHLASRVDVIVTLCKEETGAGHYYFQVDAEASIKGLDIKNADQIVKQAHLRCPVSKLLVGAKTVSVKTVNHP